LKEPSQNFEAVHSTPACPQIVTQTDGENIVIGDENCLFLSIFLPITVRSPIEYILLIKMMSGELFLFFTLYRLEWLPKVASSNLVSWREWLSKRFAFVLRF